MELTLKQLFVVLSTNYVAGATSWLFHKYRKQGKSFIHFFAYGNPFGHYKIQMNEVQVNEYNQSVCFSETFYNGRTQKHI